MSFCLPKEYTDKFKEALRTRKLDPFKLSEMTSEDRRAEIAKFVGEENAAGVNALFESKKLLKDQQKGMVTWAKQVAGMKPEIKRDMISRIEKMRDVLSPEDKESFLNDLVDQRLGTHITAEEAQHIADLSKAVSDSKKVISENDKNGSAGRLKYGSSKIALADYVNELKLENEKMTLADYKKKPFKAAVDLAGFAKAVKASLDDSALFTQGWKTVFTHPTLWAKNAMDSLRNIINQVGHKATDDSVLNGVKADIYSRKNAMNGLYDKMKLDIGNLEEAFPTIWPQKIPLFGRLYKASEVAYTAFLYRMRADIADTYIQIAEKDGVNLKDAKQARSIGKLVNSLTGRGDLGALEKNAKAINTLFFSPKKFKGDVDFLTAHLFDDTSKFAKKQAAINLTKVVIGTAIIMSVAKALNPNSVETDPRSSDFGKIKIGDTRFNISGGMGSIITLAARLMMNSTKSTTSGKVSALNTGKFASQTFGDVFSSFLSNKLSPAASFIKDLANRTDFSGNKITIQGEASNLFVPLPIQNAAEVLADPKGANFLLTVIADGLGLQSNTYSKVQSKKK